MGLSVRVWNDQHKELRKTMSNALTRANFITLFLHLHAQVHPHLEENASAMTYADSLWESVSEEALRVIPVGMEHSAVWCIWHTSRIEDVVMNILVADTPQQFYDSGWFDELGTRFYAIGNEMTPTEIVELSHMIDLTTLREYWRAVTRRTREVVSELDPAS